MKKSIILFLTIVLMQSLSAQNDSVKVKKADKRVWFDVQVTQHFGLNKWGADYINDGLPKAMLTEIKGAFNLYIARPYFGGFVDMGLGFMPAPAMNSLILDQMPMPQNATQYYLREILSESGNTGASTHFKMTLGFFGKIPTNERFSIMPYLGVGLLTMSERRYEVVLKEQGSNIQYNTSYIWNNSGNENKYGNPIQPVYLTGKLNFKYKFSRKLSIFAGLEYTWFLQSLDFYGKYTNVFNENIQRSFRTKGAKMNMIGISVGVSL